MYVCVARVGVDMCLTQLSASRLSGPPGAVVAGAVPHQESAELLSFADFLDSPWLVEWSAGLVAKYLGSWEGAPSPSPQERVGLDS